MQPPKLDGRGKDQRNNARDPDHEEVYDPISTQSYLTHVLGETTTVDGEKNKRALAANVKPNRRRLLLTQQILAGLAAGESVIDIADRLGVVTATVTAHVARHRREVEAAEIDDRLDHIAVPLATDNLIHGLIAGDKDYTLETLKGRGKLRRHTVDKNEGLGRELPVLRISIDVVGNVPGGPSPLAALPVPTADQTIAGGRIVGAARLPKPITLPDIHVPQ